MKLNQLPIHAQGFISELSSIEPQPDSIWLIGSQANGRATESSDTDLLIFGSEALYREAKEKTDAPIKVDCLIVTDGNNYQDPWQKKSGSIEKLKWQQVTESTAKYVGAKWVPDEESSTELGANMGNLIKLNESAFRVWP